MTTTEARYFLQRLTRQYRLFRLCEILIAALSGGVLVLAATRALNFSIILQWALSLTALALTIFAVTIKSRLFEFNEAKLAALVNKRFNEMEESVDLVFADSGTITMLQQLQQIKVTNRLDSIKEKIRFPHQIGRSVLFLGFAVVLLIFTVFFRNPDSKSSEAGIKAQIGKMNVGSAATKIQSAKIVTTPPSYTALLPTTSQNFNLKVPEGSSVKWDIRFSDEIEFASILISGKDSIPLKSTDQRDFSCAAVFISPGFYQLQWTDKTGKSKYSDFFSIDVIADQAPKISVTQPSQYTEFKYDKGISIDVLSTVTDDYGLNDAWIIATVSKGSGESVRFREEKIRFSSPSKFSEKQSNASVTIKLNQLGMGPGDELYFYLEATDMKTPLPNRTRTETFFVSIRDTVKINPAFDTGAGVDLLPEYFRSQRQIIIDSEKLLEEKKANKITKLNFDSRSNNLGNDQKVLRLRYGQFMGEEAEGEGTGEDMHDEGGKSEETEKSIEAKFGHTHDSGNEHNLVPEKKSTEEKNDVAKFMHDHDNTEEATFLGASIRVRLKTALSMMWDAELHLRLNDPAKSLPFQYKILRLLKEISNDSRVYVKRTGFEPPPVKEDKRLKGDLSEIPTTNSMFSQIPSAEAEVGNALLLVTNLLQQDSIILTPNQKAILATSGSALAKSAIGQPSAFLQSLTALKSLTTNDLNQREQNAALTILQKAFWKIVPLQKSRPEKLEGTLHATDKAFLQSIEKLNP